MCIFGLGWVRAVRTFTLTVSCLFALKQSPGHDCANSSALKSIPSTLDTDGRWSICGLGREELQLGFCVREMVFTRTLTTDSLAHRADCLTPVIICHSSNIICLTLLEVANHIRQPGVARAQLD
jgi:hypothetical protein